MSLCAKGPHIAHKNGHSTIWCALEGYFAHLYYLLFIFVLDDHRAPPFGAVPAARRDDALPRQLSAAAGALVDGLFLPQFH